jgi:hypothetical protein
MKMETMASKWNLWLNVGSKPQWKHDIFHIKFEALTASKRNEVYTVDEPRRYEVKISPQGWSQSCFCIQQIASLHILYSSTTPNVINVTIDYIYRVHSSWLHP